MVLWTIASDERRELRRAAGQQPHCHPRRALHRRCGAREGIQVFFTSAWIPFPRTRYRACSPEMTI